MTHFSSNLPLWYQLAQRLRGDILSGRLKQGERIPSEIALAKSNGVSVMPVRRALNALEAEKLLVRHRGSGTYVNSLGQLPCQVVTSLETLFSEEFAKPSHIIDRGTTPTPEWLVENFPDVAELTFVRRCAYLDDAPWSYGVLYLVPTYANEMTLSHLQRFPIYRLLRDLYGVHLRRSHYEVKAIGANDEIAKYLEVEPFSPVLCLRGIAYDEGAKPVGAFELIFRSDPFVLSFEIAHEKRVAEPANGADRSSRPRRLAKRTASGHMEPDG